MGSISITASRTRSGLECARRHNRIAPRNLLEIDAAQIHGHALTGGHRCLFPPVNLQRADLDRARVRQPHGLAIGLQRARDQRARHHGAKALHRKYPIDRKPERTVGAASGCGRAEGDQRAAQLLEAGAGPCRRRNDGRVFEERSTDQLTNLEGDQLQRLGIHQIRLRHRDDAGGNVQQPANLEMLPRLRHDGFIGRHHEHDAVDAADARQHVLHETFVARDVHERHIHIVDHHVREAQIDRDATFLLFL